MRKSVKISSTRERADVLLLRLKKLKDRVTVIETQYNFLNHNYTRVCEEAILKINDIKTDLEKDDDKLVKSDSDVKEINNLEARFKLGLIAPETYYEYKDILSNKVELSRSRSKLQAAIDNTANGIEFVLDKMGDGMMYPFVKIADGYNLLRSKVGKPKKQRNN